MIENWWPELVRVTQNKINGSQNFPTIPSWCWKPGLQGKSFHCIWQETRRLEQKREFVTSQNWKENTAFSSWRNGIRGLFPFQCLLLPPTTSLCKAATWTIGRSRQILLVKHLPHEFQQNTGTDYPRWRHVDCQWWKDSSSKTWSCWMNAEQVKMWRSTGQTFGLLKGERYRGDLASE